jgi:2-C-methyl-D-erythritol 4-phosphate cytidylyltransferase
MVTWVLSPFLVLLVAAMFASRWPAGKRAKLYVLMLVLSLVTVLIYTVDAFTPHAKAAVVFVVVPPASWLVMAIAAGLAAKIRATDR